MGLIPKIVIQGIYPTKKGARNHPKIITHPKDTEEGFCCALFMRPAVFSTLPGRSTALI
jgi:hypothetical protein